jgi:hypothetical protein
LLIGAALASPGFPSSAASEIDKIENENQMTQNRNFHAQDTPRESVVMSGAQSFCLNFKKSCPLI